MVILMGVENLTCDRCGSKWGKYTSKKIEERHKKDAKFFGTNYQKGIWACPKCHKLGKDEHWVNLVSR